MTKKEITNIKIMALVYCLSDIQDNVLTYFNIPIEWIDEAAEWLMYEKLAICIIQDDEVAEEFWKSIKRIINVKDKKEKYEIVVNEEVERIEELLKKKKCNDFHWIDNLTWFKKKLSNIVKACLYDLYDLKH